MKNHGTTAADVAKRAGTAAKTISCAATTRKNEALRIMAELLEKNTQKIVLANRKDLAEAEKKGITNSLYERLIFDEAKIQSRIHSLHTIASLPDPVGQAFSQAKLPNGLVAQRVRVPLGVLLMIYEARPHVTINAGAFSIKSGNTIICKGGSEAAECNTILGRLWQEALKRAGLPVDCVQVVMLSHKQVDELLGMQEAIDLVIPRGGKTLIRTVAEKTRIPVIKHFEGVCHIYIGPGADIDKATQIALDSKLLMPAVCNAAETILVDKAEAGNLNTLLNALVEKNIVIRGCPRVCAMHEKSETATEDDWHTEYLDRIYSVRVVEDIDHAIEHIQFYGSGHTDVIVTENYSMANKFVNNVDSSVVLVNASTMFCDGETLGMGAEIGISTDKFHARGPMGLNELTSYKHVVFGEGQIMGGPY